LDCEPIVNVTTPIIDSEFIAVFCKKEKFKEPKIVDMFTLPRPKESLIEAKEGAIDVIILGLDSTSRLNFIRSMPTSYKYLKKSLNAISMVGYNKVGGKQLKDGELRQSRCIMCSRCWTPIMIALC